MEQVNGYRISNRCGRLWSLRVGLKRVNEEWEKKREKNEGIEKKQVETMSERLINLEMEKQNFIQILIKF